MKVLTVTCYFISTLFIPTCVSSNETMLKTFHIMGGTENETVVANTPTITGCAEFTERGQVIPDQKYWTELRDAYIASVGVEASTIEWPIISDSPFSGLPTSMAHVQYSKGMGRGVFATRFIPAGTPVWDLQFHAIFSNEALFKDFLSRINREQACDILQWCYAMEIEDELDYAVEEELGIGCGLDEGSIFNHGKGDIANVGYGEDADEMVALRDIEAGEEFLQDYTTFEVSLRWYDELLDEAWGDLGDWDERGVFSDRDEEDDVTNLCDENPSVVCASS